MKRLRAALATLLLGPFLVGAAAAHDTVYYYSDDTLHSEVVITDASRNVVERTYYAPYGQVLNRALRDGPGYTGHEEDPETSLVYMQQRYFDPESGRFLSNDPVATASDGAAFNRYAYANDNPYRYTDPAGTDAVAAEGVLFDVGKADAIEEVGGGGPENPLADVAAVVTTVGGLVYAGYELIQPIAHHNDEAGTGASNGSRAGKDHTRAAKKKAREINRSQNGGKLVCPDCKEGMTEPQQGQSGVTPDPKEAVGDHVDPKSQGGDGATAKDLRNIKTRCRECNGIKSDSPEPKPPPPPPREQ